MMPAIRARWTAQTFNRYARIVFGSLMMYVMRVNISERGLAPILFCLVGHQQRKVGLLCSIAVCRANQVLKVTVILAMRDRAVERDVLVVTEPSLNNVRQKETICVVVVGWIEYKMDRRDRGKIFQYRDVNILCSQEVVVPHPIRILWRA